MNILWGIIFIVAGALLTIYSEKIRQTFGQMEWAERVLGLYGGTRLMIKLIGITVILLGFLTFTDLLEPMGRSITKTLFGT